MANYTKQLPQISTSDRPFWEAAQRHELTAYRCNNCGTYYSQVTECVVCGNPQMAWVKVSGKGRIFTYCVFHQLYHPAWKGDIPYNVAWIKLDEGPIMIGNILDIKNEDIRIDMPVEAVFDDVTPEVTLPKFKPISK